MSTAEDNALLQIGASRTFANDISALAEVALNQAMQVALALAPPEQSNAPPLIKIDPPAPHLPDKLPEYKGPQFEAVDFTASAPTLLQAPALILPAEPGAPPELPAFVLPDLPQGGQPNEELLANIPAIGDVTLAAPPDLLAEIRGIPKPVLSDIVIPAAPAYQAPEFLGVRPVDPGQGPTDLDVTLRQQYDTMAPTMRAALNGEVDAFLTRINPAFHTAMAAIEDRLATYLQGGSALAPAVEDALYNRTLDKVNADGRRARDAIYSEAAKGGHVLMAPSIAGLLQATDQARRDNTARAATDIYVKQAELEQQNLQFAVSASSKLRELAVQSAVQYAGSLVSLNGQAIDYAGRVVDSIVKVYDIATRHAEVQARLYEADAQIYEAKQRGAMAVLQAYEAQLRGLEAQASVDTAKVTAYRAFVDAVGAEATVYRSQAEFATAQAAIERLKIELYQARVGAYAAQVNAQNARLQGYEATVRGKSAEQSAAAERVRAFTAQYESFSAIVRARETQIQSIAQSNESGQRVFTAQVEANRVINETRAATVRANLESFDATLRAYTTKEQTQAEYYRSTIAQYGLFLQGMVEQVRMYLENQRERDTLLVERVKAVAEIAGEIGRNYSQISSAALAGLNSLISVVANDAG